MEMRRVAPWNASLERQLDLLLDVLARPLARGARAARPPPARLRLGAAAPEEGAEEVGEYPLPAEHLLDFVRAHRP